MNNNKQLSIFLPFLFVLITCCVTKKTPPPVTSEQLKEPLIEMNKNYAKLESEQIDAYVKRHDWDVIKTGTGLRYMIYQQGKGELAKDQQLATINFEISLLDGTVCYSSKAKGAEKVLIGMDDVESGLHEGLTYLKVGDRAKMILPSHMAHGLVGDMNKIPLRATIIYDVELLALQ